MEKEILTEYLKMHSEYMKEGMIILPRNIDSAKNSDEFIYEESAQTIFKILKAKDDSFPIYYLSKDEKKYITEKEFNLIIPAIFITFSLLSQNPELVQISLNLISSYIFDFFKGVAGKKNVKIDYCSEKSDGSFCKFNFKGPVEALPTADKIIKKLKNG